MWHLLPLSTGAVETAAEPAWLMTALDAAIAPEQTLSISPVLLRALDEAAAAGRVAETILLAHRIVGVQDLAMLDPSDMVRVADALDAAGQSDAVGGPPRDRRITTVGTCGGSRAFTAATDRVSGTGDNDRCRTG